MSDESIKLTIGAAKGASFDRVYADIRKGAQRVGAEISRFLNPVGAIKGLERYKQLLLETAGLVRAQGGEQAKQHNERVRQTRTRYSEEERAAQKLAREQEKAARYVANLRMRMLRDEDRERTRAEQRAAATQERSAQRFGRMTSHRATRFLWSNAPSLSMAGRFANDIARGVGLDLSPSSMISSGVGLEKAAVKLSNTSYIAGDERNGERKAPAELMKVARDIGAKYGRDPEEVLAALDAFKKPTGDLKSGLEANDSLAKLGASQGMDLSELYGTAGNVTKAIRNQVAPDQVAGVVNELMRNFIHQGMVGSVEAEDLAKYGSKITAGAMGYEGSVVENLKKRVALAQVAMEFGGATSAAGAATAVERLDTTFETGARVKEFKKAGIEVMSGNKKRDPIEIIKDAVEKTMGDPVAFNKLFMNILGAKAGKGLQTVYQTAFDANGGSKEAGREAIDKYLAKLTGGTLTDQRVQEDIDAVRGTKSFKVNEANIHLQERVDESFARMAPQLERLLPVLEGTVDKIASFAGWIAEDPITRVITVALATSIARAGIESTLRIGIEKGFSGLGSIVSTVAQQALAGTTITSAGAATTAAGAAGAGAAATLAAGAAAGIGTAFVAAKGLGRLMFGTEEERKANEKAAGNEGDGSPQSKLAALQARAAVIRQDLQGARATNAISNMGGYGAVGVGAGPNSYDVGALLKSQAEVNAQIAQLMSAMSGGLPVRIEGDIPGRDTQALY